MSSPGRAPHRRNYFSKLIAVGQTRAHFSFLNTFPNKKKERTMDQPPSPADHLAIGLESTRSNYVTHMLSKLKQDGFRLKLMVVGESGLGKTTLIDTLFRTNVKDESSPQSAYLNAKTVTIEKREVCITEGDVSLNLTVVDTPGYGDAINNEDAWQPVLDYIDVELEHYMANSEDLTLRGKVPDTRVHACLYFMAPHRFKDVDLEFMQRLHSRVNLIPVIAKADTMTTNEIREYKTLILETLQKHSITVYPTGDAANPEIDSALTSIEAFRLPFAVIGSNERFELKDDIPGSLLKRGACVSGREYPWGMACIEDDRHCDVGRLRECILHNFPQLLDATEEVYQDFRCGELALKEQRKYDGVKQCCNGFLFLVVKTVITSLLLHWPYTMGIILGSCLAASLIILTIVAIVICVSPKANDDLSLRCPNLALAIRYIACLQIRPSRHERKKSLNRLARGESEATSCCGYCLDAEPIDGPGANEAVPGVVPPGSVCVRMAPV